MLGIGFKVKHVDFPPFEGVVTQITEQVNNKRKITVSDGSRLMYGLEDEWEPIIEQIEDDFTNNDEDVIDIIDGEYREIE